MTPTSADVLVNLLILRSDMKKLMLAAALPAALIACDAKQKPNVVIIMADDLGWGDVGYHGSVIQTPNIDRLASDGIELDRHYAASVSSPTRAGLMTGRYPSRFGIRETVIPPWREYGLPVEERTIADMLADNGYKDRAVVGKWHLGHGRMAYYPLNRGFTHFYGHLNGAVDYFTHEREGELDWHDDWDSSYDKGYSTDLLTEEAVKCIDDYSKSGPYFLYVAFNAPHTPYQAPEDEIAEHISLDEFNALPKKDKNGYTYRAMVTRLDKGIGKILDAIERSGEKDNTLILFMSDNGGVPGMEPYSTNAPLRGTKFTEFDGGVRVNAVISWPKRFKQGGRKVECVTSFVDILPTLADIVGDRRQPNDYPCDGSSLLPLLTGKVRTLDRDIYLGVGAAVNNDCKMIIAGRNKGMGLQRDFFIDYESEPYEAHNSPEGLQDPEKRRMKDFIIQYDTITPYWKEIPFGQGRNGFVPPKEWKVTKP